MEKQEEKIWHSPDEQPEFYPEQVKSVGKSAILIDEHSKYYEPTQESKDKLQKDLKRFDRWAYLRNLVHNR